MLSPYTTVFICSCLTWPSVKPIKYTFSTLAYCGFLWRMVFWAIILNVYLATYSKNFKNINHTAFFFGVQTGTLFRAEFLSLDIIGILSQFFVVVVL